MEFNAVPPSTTNKDNASQEQAAVYTHPGNTKSHSKASAHSVNKLDWQAGSPPNLHVTCLRSRFANVSAIIISMLSPTS